MAFRFRNSPERHNLGIIKSWQNTVTFAIVHHVAEPTMSESHGKNGVPSFLIEKPYGELRGSLRPPPQALPSISETKASSHSLSFATMAAKLSISEAGTDVPSVWPMTKVPEAHNTGGGKDSKFR